MIRTIRLHRLETPPFSTKKAPQGRLSDDQKYAESLLNFDLDFFLFGLFRLGKVNLQNPVFVRSADLVPLDLLRELNGSGKASITSFNQMIISLLLFPPLFLFTFNG